MDFIFVDESTSHEVTNITLTEAGSHSHTITASTTVTVNSTGDGEAFSIVNPFVAIPYIIKC
jgi:hypothetical protein